MAVTLRNKKNEAKKKKKSLKNVMASPYTEYWPKLTNDEDIEEMATVLNTNLIRLIQQKCQVPWQLLQNQPQENRKAIRESYRIQQGIHPLTTNNNARNFIVLGVNEVTKLLENDLAEAVLISADVNPYLMVKHIIDISVWKNVPVLIVPILKKITLSAIGCSCVTIAFKTNAENASPYTNITEKIKELYRKFPPPTKHINSSRREETKDDKLEDEPSVMEVIELSDEEAKDVFLNRIPNGKAFVPALSIASAERRGAQVASEEFLSLNELPAGYIPFESDTTSHRNSNKKKISYKSLLVRTVTGDPNRPNKKIAKVKSNQM